ncbi:MAG: hypothetical protein BroJett042_23210 [Bacteroidota bacterium]|nr:MAG: hypothetical protein BroJett042_23210 [Bacteroidota bacterium]HNQ13361.1 hypothetical protein [Bacteroidia bacterium]
MKYRQCLHYDEILKVLSENRDLEDISFRIDAIQNCPLCYSAEEAGVCLLWISLAFVEDMKPQLSISEAKVTIDTLEEQMKDVALKLVRNIKREDEHP